MRHILTTCILAALLAGAPAARSAHHGAAAYVPNAVTILTATITAFEWRNPHALIRFDATDEDGAVRHWTAETAGPVILLRAGWRRDVLRPGDRVTIVGRPAANGSPTMLLQRVELERGGELTSYIPPK